MSSIASASIVLACAFGASLVGMLLGALLPKHHLEEGTREVVRMGTGLIATLAALILGLLVASAKSNFDSINEELAESGAKLLLLDRALAGYGPEAKEARELLQKAATTLMERVRTYEDTGRGEWSFPQSPTGVSDLQRVPSIIMGLSPQNDAQRWLQSRALEAGGELTRSRWILLDQSARALPTPFLVVLVLWLAIIFSGFGLLAPRNLTVTAVLFVCGLSAAGAVFLILELNHPFGGVIRVSGASLYNALLNLGK